MLSHPQTNLQQDVALDKLIEIHSMDPVIYRHEYWGNAVQLSIFLYNEPLNLIARIHKLLYISIAHKLLYIFSATEEERKPLMQLDWLYVKDTTSAIRASSTSLFSNKA
jgi:hypothetical protein